MKRIFLFASFVGIMATLYYLYQRQLGAISFLLLSIFFFSLAVSQFTKQSSEDMQNDYDNTDI